MPGSSRSCAIAVSGSTAVSRSTESRPSSAARATACSRSSFTGGSSGKSVTSSSRAGVGNAQHACPASSKARPYASDSRCRTRAICRAGRRADSTAQAAASYGEWNCGGRSPGATACSLPSTGSRRPTAWKASPSWSSDRMRATWRVTGSGSASPWTVTCTPGPSWRTSTPACSA